MLHFRYARMKNCAESLIFAEAVLPALVLSKRDGLLPYHQAARDKCTSKVHLSAMKMLTLPIWTPSVLHPIKYTGLDRARFVRPQVSRAQLRATSHRVLGEQPLAEDGRIMRAFTRIAVTVAFVLAVVRFGHHGHPHNYG